MLHRQNLQLWTVPALLFAIAGFLWAPPLNAQDTKEEIPPLAVQPEVQTAEWAQKWWMPRHKQKLAEKNKLDKVDLIMIGDSITHGWEGAGKSVWNKFYADRYPLNLGFSGDRTEQVLWRLEHGEVEGVSPKLVVLMIGTNNTGHRQDPPEETAAGVNHILAALKKRLPKTKVLVLGIFPRGADSSDPLRKLNVATNERIQRMADNEQVFYLDISSSFLDDDGKLPKEIMPDLLHPNEKGYEIWAEALEPTVKRLLASE